LILEGRPRQPKIPTHELKGQCALLTLLTYVTEKRPVTFGYAACEDERNSVFALKELLEQSKQR
jgi:hypothetical protein